MSKPYKFKGLSKLGRKNSTSYGEEKQQAEAAKDRESKARIARLLSRAQADTYLDSLKLDETKIVQLHHYDINLDHAREHEQEQYRACNDLPSWSYVEASLESKGYSVMTSAHSIQKDEPLWGKRFAVPRNLFDQDLKV